MNSAAPVSLSSRRASSNVHRSKRDWPSCARRRSAPSNRQSRKTLRGRAPKSGARRRSSFRPRKSQRSKRQPPSVNLSNWALRKSTDVIVARCSATTLSSSGRLGSLSRWDTAPRCELTFVGQLRRLLRVRLLAVLNEDLVDLRQQRVHELVLGIDAADFALAEDRALADTAGDSDVGVLSLAGSVDLAAHDRDLHRRGQRAQALLGDLRKRDEVDVRATARRAGHQRESLVAQTQRLQDVEAGRDFHDRILG